MEMTHEAQAARRERPHIDYWSWAKTGMIAGIIAGLAFAVFEMIVAGIITGNFFAPFRMISAVALGQAALTPEVSLGVAIITGTLVHLAYSIVAGAVFALIIAAIPPLHATTWAVILSASVLGLLMWLLNFYAIAPAAGWSWFPQRANQFWQGFVAHTFLYGSVAGWYLATRKKH
jgi:hypothetical protein